MLTYMDEFVDELLTKKRSVGTALWELPSRQALEDLDQLEPRESPLQAELDAMDEENEDVDMGDANGGNNSASEDGRSVNGRSASDEGSMSD